MLMLKRSKWLTKRQELNFLCSKISNNFLLSLDFFKVFLTFIYLFSGICVCMPHCPCGDRLKIYLVKLVLLLCQFRGLNSGHQAWQQVPSHQPPSDFYSSLTPRGWSFQPPLLQATHNSLLKACYTEVQGSLQCRALARTGLSHL